MVRNTILATLAICLLGLDAPVAQDVEPRVNLLLKVGLEKMDDGKLAEAAEHFRVAVELDPVWASASRGGLRRGTDARAPDAVMAKRRVSFAP